MKKLLLFFSCFPVLVSAQYLFNFEDSLVYSWNQYPSGRWNVSDDRPLSGAFSLQHSFDNVESGRDVTTFAFQNPLLTDALKLSFRVRHGYNPSSANNWQVSLLNSGDSAMLSNGQLTPGFYFGVNLKGSDDLLKLWELTGTEITELLNTGINYQEAIGTEAAPFFSLMRYPDGSWEVFYALSGDNVGAVSAGISAAHATSGEMAGRYFLLRYNYSSSQDRKLWLDDLEIEGTFVTDTVPPSIVKVQPLGWSEVEIECSENIRPGPQTHFILEDEHRPVFVEISGNRIILSFNVKFENRVKQSLQVGRIMDNDGNMLTDTTLLFSTNYAEWGDVVINEILFDPVPTVYLPECEYIELYNRSGYDISLAGWKVVVNGKGYEVEMDSLLSDGYRVLTGSGCEQLFNSIKAIPCLASGSVLKNSGGEIALYNQFDLLVHVSGYSEPGGEGSWKNEGGWSVERIDPDHLCGNRDNTGYSEDPSGGTPGYRNSIFGEVVDESPPVLLYFGIGGAGEVKLYFSELLERGNLDKRSFSLGPGETVPDSVIISEPWFSRLDLFFREGILTEKGTRLYFHDISDCMGNQPEINSCEIGLPGLPAPGSILVNEVMYDPVVGAPEFIELYNNTSDFFDLKDLKIGVSEIEGIPGALYPVCEDSHILVPGGYIVLTSDRAGLMTHYHLMESGRWLVPLQMPGLLNSGAFISLYDRSGNRLDHMHYRDDMHLSLVGNSRGISLERISPVMPGNDPASWHSAASTADYATPGERNSQSLDAQGPDQLLEIFPGVFSPDNDGFEDLLEISLRPVRPGFLLQMVIIDRNGNRIRELSNNELLGIENRFSWDGRDDNGSMAFEGLYLLYAILFHPETGEKHKIKKVFALIY